jgi:hypothetical protein
VNDEVVKMWKEEVVAEFKVLSRNMSLGSKEDHKKSSFLVGN